MNAATYRWLGWKPGKNIQDSPGTEPTKPTKAPFEGFEGAAPGESQIFHAPAPGPSEPLGAIPLPDPFGPLPLDPADAAAEQAMRQRLREPKYAAIIARNTGDGTPRSLAIRAAAAVWAQGGPEGIARRRAEAFRGVPPGLVAGRQVALRAPEGQPGPGEWVGISAGNAEVLGWDLARGEALVRLLAAAAWRWIPMRSLGEPRRF